MDNKATIEELQRRIQDLEQEAAKRKGVGDTVRESEARLRLITDNMLDTISQIDDQGRIQYLSPSVKRIFGHEPEEMLGRHAMELVHPEDVEEVRAAVRRAIKERLASLRLVYRYRLVGGDYYWVESETRFLYDEQNRFTGSVFASRDITDRKRMEESLRESEERYRTVLDSLGDMIHVVDRDLRIRLMNTALEHMIRRLGLNAEAVGQTVFEVFPFLPEAVRDEYRWVIEAGKALLTEETLTIDGREIMTETRKIPVVERGEVTWIITVIRDVTERARADRALRESETRFREFADSLPQTAFEMNETGRLTFVNRNALDAYGYTREDMENGLHALQMIAPEDRERASQNIRQVAGGEIIGGNEYTAIRKDGTRFPVVIHSTPAVRDGNPAGLRGFMIDITSRKLAEEALRRSEERYRALVENAPLGILSMDREGRILDINPMLLRILGWPSAEAARSTNPLAFAPLVEAGISEDFRRCLDTGEPGVHDRPYTNMSGRRAHMRYHVRPIGGPEGEVEGVQAMVEDISEAKKLEAQYRHAQKMEAVGTLAGGVAHDFNNLLQVVHGYTELLLQGSSQTDGTHESLKRIKEAADRGRELSRQLLTFSRKAEGERRPVDLNFQVRDVRKLLERTIPKMIEIELSLAEDLKIVHADPFQIEQMLMNLAVNAKDAMPDGGKIVVRTRNANAPEGFVPSGGSASPTPCVLIEFMDTGCGMDQGILDRVFEPFFTTKEVGKGTGLGLAMVYGIVKNHDGFITCESRPGAGTSFRIYLPTVPERARPQETREDGAVVRGGRETVLVVDDEEPIRDLVVDMLYRSGYTALTASDGERAVKLYRAERERIDLVILDIIMPGMGGIRCLEEILRVKPSARVLVATGIATEESAKDCMAAGARGFLSKPYRSSEMLRSVREVLDER
jgi:two-component system, cell cycle sensor histidine kinase and response regulator CckA